MTQRFQGSHYGTITLFIIALSTTVLISPLAAAPESENTSGSPLSAKPPLELQAPLPFSKEIELYVRPADKKRAQAFVNRFAKDKPDHLKILENVFIGFSSVMCNGKTPARKLSLSLLRHSAHFISKRPKTSVFEVIQHLHRIPYRERRARLAYASYIYGSELDLFKKDGSSYLDRLKDIPTDDPEDLIAHTRQLFEEDEKIVTKLNTHFGYEAPKKGKIFHDSYSIADKKRYFIEFLGGVTPYERSDFVRYGRRILSSASLFPNENSSILSFIRILKAIQSLPRGERSHFLDTIPHINASLNPRMGAKYYRDPAYAIACIAGTPPQKWAWIMENIAYFAMWEFDNYIEFQGTSQINRVFHSFCTRPQDESEKIIQTARLFFCLNLPLENLHSIDFRWKVFMSLRGMPFSEIDDVAHHVLGMVQTEEMPLTQCKEIPLALTALGKVPQDEREELIALSRDLALKRTTNKKRKSLSYALIMSALTQIPQEERASVVSSLTPLLHHSNEEYRASLIPIVARIPQEERDAFVTLITSLITPQLQGYESLDYVTDVMSAFADIQNPQERERVATYYKDITQERREAGYTLSVEMDRCFVTKLSQIQEEERPLFVKYARELFKARPKNFVDTDKEFFYLRDGDRFYKVGIISRELMPVSPGSCLDMMKTSLQLINIDTPLRERASVIAALRESDPHYHRLLGCTSMDAYGFTWLVKGFLTVPPENRSVFLDRLLPLIPKDMNSIELGNVMAKLSKTPFTDSKDPQDPESFEGKAMKKLEDSFIFVDYTIPPPTFDPPKKNEEKETPPIGTSPDDDPCWIDCGLEI